MTTQANPKSMTVDEWLQYDDIPEGFHAELVNAELVMNPLAGWPHQFVVSNLTRLLAAYWLSHPDRIVALMIPARMPIPGGSEGREPDMALYAERPQDPNSRLAWKQVRPFLAIEVVSPEQERRDYVEKYSSYHLAGIPEYWIVDPQARRFTALRWRPERWEQQVIEERGTYTTLLLPELSLEVEAIWA